MIIGGSQIRRGRNNANHANASFLADPIGIRHWRLLKVTDARHDNEMSETRNSHVLAGGSFRVRILTVLVPKTLPLGFRPHTPFVFRVLVGGAIALA